MVEMGSQEIVNNRKAYIDIIRAISVCLIFFYHFSGYISLYNTSLPTLYKFSNGNWGNIGVYLFFMISGNCLHLRYNNEFHLKDFWLNRFIKILIPFWICYAFFFLLNFWQYRIFPEIPTYKFLLTIIGMDGFLAYKTETFYILGELFLGGILILYLLFPIVRRCIKKNIHVTLAVLFVFYILLCYNNFFYIFEIQTRRNPLVGLFYFVSGIWIERVIKAINKGRILVVLAVCLCGFLTLTVKLHVNENIGELIVTVAFFVFFMHIEKVMEIGIINKIISWFSKNSYLIFLTHHVVLQKVSDHFMGMYYSFKGVFCVFAIAVLLIYLFIICYNRLMSKQLQS